MELTSIKQARKALKRGAECNFVNVTKNEDCRAQSGVEARAFPENNLCGKLDQNKRQEMQELLSQRAACFPEELPMELPPSRRCDHEIKVEESSRPPSRPPFRMSAPEMDELQRQLQDLISHGFIEPSNSPYGAAHGKRYTTSKFSIFVFSRILIDDFTEKPA